LAAITSPFRLDPLVTIEVSHSFSSSQHHLELGKTYRTGENVMSEHLKSVFENSGACGSSKYAKNNN